MVTTARRSTVVTVAIVAFVGSMATADDFGPSREQVTERTEGLAALWQSLRARTAGLRINVREELLSTGEFEGARLGWFRTGIGLQAGAPLGDKFTIGVSPSFAWERLTVQGSDDFVIGVSGRDVRFTDFYDSGLRIGASYEIDENWSLEALTGWSARHEAGADFIDASQVGGSLAVNYRRGKWLRLRLGVGIGADLGDRQLRFSPVYRVIIRPVEGWSLEASGLGGTIEWDATAHTTLSLGGRADGTQYRLDRRGRPPTSGGDGVLQRRQTRLEAGVLYRWSDNVRIRGGIGCVLNEEIEISDEDGMITDARQERDPSVTVLLGVDLRI